MNVIFSKIKFKTKNVNISKYKFINIKYRNFGNLWNGWFLWTWLIVLHDWTHTPTCSNNMVQILKIVDFLLQGYMYFGCFFAVFSCFKTFENIEFLKNLVRISKFFLRICWNVTNLNRFFWIFAKGTLFFCDLVPSQRARDSL